MIYYLILIGLFVLSIFEIIIKKKYSVVIKGYYIVVLLFLILFVGSRHYIGYDFVPYQNGFQNISQGVYTERFEVGYYLLNKISPTFEILLLIVAIISIGVKMLCLLKESEYKFLSLLILYSTIILIYDMGVIRQAISIAFTLYSIKFIKNRKCFSFFISMLISILFHTTAIVFLPVYFIAGLNISEKMMYLCVSVSFIASFLIEPNTILNILMKIRIPIVMQKIQEYSLNSDYNTAIISINMIRRIIQCIFFIWFYYKFLKENYNAKIYVNIYFVGTCFFYIMKPFNLLSSRGSTYFSIVEVFILPIIYNEIKNKIFKNLFLIFIFIYCLYFVNSSLQDTLNVGQSLTPYNSFIFN